MMRDNAQEPLKPLIGTTALHMADALMFLERVAVHAGLQSVAVKLASVRLSLLEETIDHKEELAAGCEDGNDPGLNGDQNERRGIN